MGTLHGGFELLERGLVSFFERETNRCGRGIVVKIGGINVEKRIQEAPLVNGLIVVGFQVQRIAEKLFEWLGIENICLIDHLLVVFEVVVLIVHLVARWPLSEGDHVVRLFRLGRRRRNVVRISGNSEEVLVGSFPPVGEDKVCNRRVVVVAEGVHGGVVVLRAKMKKWILGEKTGIAD